MSEAVTSTAFTRQCHCHSENELKHEVLPYLREAAAVGPMHIKTKSIFHWIWTSPEWFWRHFELLCGVPAEPVDVTGETLGFLGTLVDNAVTLNSQLTYVVMCVVMCYESIDNVDGSQIMLSCAVAYWSVGPVYCYVIGGVCLLVPLLLLTNVKQHAMSWCLVSVWYHYHSTMIHIYHCTVSLLSTRQH